VQAARLERVPFLGICLGFQVAVIEYARNVLGWSDAHSTEFDPATKHPVISELPDQKRLEGIMGGTMRLGAQDVQIERGTLAHMLFGGKDLVRERFRHRYEVEPKDITALAAGGLVFSGRHPKHPIMQVLELPLSAHPYFIGAQFHPELTSRPLDPQPMFMGLLAAAIARREPEFASSELGRRWVRTANGAGTPVRA
jgi:CTP synthase